MVPEPLVQQFKQKRWGSGDENGSKAICAHFEFALFPRLGCSLVEVIHFRLISRKNFIIRHMAEEITSLVEEGSSNDQMPHDATLDPMETVIKELAGGPQES